VSLRVWQTLKLRKAECRHLKFRGHFIIDEKVKIKCTKCSQVFRERAQKIRNGFQANCQHCNRLRSISVRKIGISAGLSCAPKRCAWRLRNMWRKARPALDSPLREMAGNHA